MRANVGSTRSESCVRQMPGSFPEHATTPRPANDYPAISWYRMARPGSWTVDHDPIAGTISHGAYNPWVQIARLIGISRRRTIADEGHIVPLPVLSARPRRPTLARVASLPVNCVVFRSFITAHLCPCSDRDHRHEKSDQDHELERKSAPSHTQSIAPFRPFRPFRPFSAFSVARILRAESNTRARVPERAMLSAWHEPLRWPTQCLCRFPAPRTSVPPARAA